MRVDPDINDDGEILGAWVLITVITLAVIGVHLVMSSGPLPKETAQSGSPSLLGSDWIEHEQLAGVVGSAPRSPKWPTVRANFIADGNDRCAVCGSRDDLNVHHVVPFHDDPSLELKPSNLITLCRQHHLHVGHDPDGPGAKSPNWSTSNPHVRRDADWLRSHIMLGVEHE